MRVHEILRTKGNNVYQISLTATLAEMVDQLVKFNCGSMIVSDGDSIVGIITERDILKAIAAGKQQLDKLLVCDYMTRNLVLGQPSDDVESVMGLMTSHRVRHLPIMEDGRLAGMISIGDVVKALYETLALENHNMKAYIQS